MSASMYFEYYGRTDVKDDILEVLEGNWRKNKEEVEHAMCSMLYYQCYLDVIDVGFISVPRDFNMTDYIGNFPTDGISVFMVAPCGSSFLLNLDVRCMDLYFEEFYFHGGHVTEEE